MHVLLLLLVDHVSQLNSGNTLLCCFGLVLTPPKIILQKISVRGNPKYVFKKQTDHDSPQY